MNLYSSIKEKLIAVLLATIFLISTFSTLPIVFAGTTNSAEILSGRLPIAYGAADSDEFDFNDSKARYGSKLSESENGYSETETATKEFWSGYLSKFTDSDAESEALVRPYSSGDRIILIYKFPDYYFLNYILLLEPIKKFQ